MGGGGGGARENHKKGKKNKEKTKHTPWAKILQKYSDKEIVFHWSHWMGLQFEELEIQHTE